MLTMNYVFYLAIFLLIDSNESNRLFQENAERNGLESEHYETITKEEGYKFEEVTLSRPARDIPSTSDKHDTCLQMFRISLNTIIRTKDSKLLGAKYLNETQVEDKESCIHLCCENKDCNVIVFEEKGSKGCYMFDCGAKEEFKCKFTSHSDYTSATLLVNHQQLDLHLWGAEKQQEAKVLSEALSTTSTLVGHKSNTCRRFEFECQTGGECIAIYNVCDGIPQCQDKSDEVPALTCPSVSSTVFAATVPTMESSTLVPYKYHLPSKEYLPEPMKTNMFPIPKGYPAHYDGEFANGPETPPLEHFNRHSEGFESNWKESPNQEYSYGLSDPYNEHLVREDMYRYRPNNYYSNNVYRNGYGRENGYGLKNPMYEWNIEDTRPKEPPHRFDSDFSEQGSKLPLKANLDISTVIPQTTTISLITNKTFIIPTTSTTVIVTPSVITPKTLELSSFDVDGPTQHFSGAVFVLVVGLAMTIMLGCIIIWRYKLIRYKLKLGGRTFAYDADYLVNGMYL